MSNLTYSFDSDIVPERSEHTPSGTYGVHITLEPDALDLAMSKIDLWFDSDERSEVFLIDSGHTQKAEDAFIILEWENRFIDPDFLKILDQDNRVLDYTLYNYGADQEGEE